MPGCSQQRRDQVRVALGEPLQRDAPGLAREADEAQAARGHHHDLGQLVALLDLGRAPDSSVTAPPARRPRVADATARPAVVGRRRPR